MKKLVLAFCTLCAVWSGCSSATAPLDGDIMELYVGKVIRMRLSVEYPDGTQELGEGIATRVLRDTIVNGETWYFLEDGEYAVAMFGYWAQNKSDGHWALVPSADQSILGEPLRLYRQPPVIGNRDSLYIAPDYSYATVTSAVDTTVVSAGKSYSGCTVYEYTSWSHHSGKLAEDFKRYIFIKPGVGIVLWYQYLPAMVGGVSTLVRYKVEPITD